MPKEGICGPPAGFFFWEGKSKGKSKRKSKSKGKGDGSRLLVKISGGATKKARSTTPGYPRKERGANLGHQNQEH